MALSVRLKAARSSSPAPSRSGAGGDSAGSVAAYGSIASSAIRTNRARAATPAAAARIASGSGIVHDQHRPAGMVQDAGRDTAEHGGGDRGAAAAACDDHAGVELVRRLQQGGEERAGGAHGARLGLEAGGARELR